MNVITLAAGQHWLVAPNRGVKTNENPVHLARTIAAVISLPRCLRLAAREPAPPDSTAPTTLQGRHHFHGHWPRRLQRPRRRAEGIRRLAASSSSASSPPALLRSGRLAVRAAADTASCCGRAGGSAPAKSRDGAKTAANRRRPAIRIRRARPRSARTARTRSRSTTAARARSHGGVAEWLDGAMRRAHGDGAAAHRAQARLTLEQRLRAGQTLSSSCGWPRCVRMNAVGLHERRGEGDVLSRNGTSGRCFVARQIARRPG